MVKKPEFFLEEVWNKLSDKEQKEIYLEDLLSENKIPAYAKSAIEDIEAGIDIKIDILERIMNGENLTEKETKLIDFNQIQD